MIGRGAIAAGGMILVVCAAWAASQESASHGENRQLCEKIVRKVVEGKPEAAFAALEPRCVIPKGTLQPVREQTIQKLADARKAFGTIIGFDLIKEERVRDFAHRLTYVTRYERMAVRWSFDFYRPRRNREWVITGFSWDPGVEPLYVEVQRPG